MLIALGVGALGLALWAGLFALSPVAVFAPAGGKPIMTPSALLAVPGLLVGGALLALPLAWANIGAWSLGHYLRALGGFAALALLAFGLVWAVRFEALPAAKAALAGLLGVITLLLAFPAVEAVKANDGVSFETHWGGLGGGLGGWRLSTAAVLTALLLLFASATVSVVLFDPSKLETTASPPSTPPSIPSANDKAKDEAK